MRKASFNASLPTVNSLSSHEGSQASSHHSTTSGNRRPSRNSTNSTQGSSFNRGMKRSPYLSAMAIDNHESEDLVVALSRPGRVASVSPEGVGGAAGGGIGGMGFFNLKRPGSWTGQQMQEEGLQRPQGVQGQGQQGGLQLQRPQQGQSMGGGITPVSSEGTTTTVGTEDHPTMSVDESDDGNGGGEGNAHFPSVAPSALKQTGGGATGGTNTGGRAARMPSLRSALRVNSSAQLQQSSQREGTTTTNNNNNNNNNNNSGGGMKKNTSVTFSMNTKNPSRLGLQFANNINNEGGGATDDTAAVGNNDAFPLFANNNPRASKDYSASGMMRKSQSICAPEYLLSHSPAGSSSGSGGGSGSAHSGGGGGGSGGGEGNASFPIYFAKLGGQQSQAPQQGLPPQPQLHQSNQEQIRRKSKSMNTLQYSYQNEELLSSSSNSSNPNANDNNACGNKLFGALGITPSSRVNLKFRDMLDEGDGNEGDLNLRLRNQQWKDFRMFSKEFESENPMLVSIEEGVAASGGGGAALTTVDSAAGGGAGADNGGAGATPMSTNVKPSTSSLSGSKRAISPSSTTGQTSSHSTSSKTAAAFMNSFGSHRQLNSHRASVSVNDLAMLRRSAARMRVGPSSSSNTSSSNRSFATTTTTSPGATLGGEMLSRISSRNSIMSINSSTGSGGAAAAAATENTLSPLAQMMAKSANLSSKQQQDLFLSKAKYQMSNDTTSSSAAAAGMGRRVHTVGAGLAYGGPNLSRFDLGSLRKDLSIMSGGSGSSGAGKNEEWDL
eukprot:scaffold28035_cov211-Skeletonema_marinoi.AAC.11